MKAVRQKIAFLAPFYELAETVRKVAEEQNEDIAVFTGVENYPGIAEIEKQGFDAMITRGPMVNMLRSKTSIPVIRCDPSGYDLFKAFAEAKQYDSTVGLITSWELSFDKAEIENFLDISVWISNMCNNREDIYREVSSAVSLGIRVVVGGTITAEAAPQYGIRCAKLLTGKETIIESIEKAKETVRVSREKQAEAERLKIILNLEQNGIVSIDEQKIVTVFNSAAEEITGIKKDEIIGKSIEKYLPDSPILENLQTAKSTFGEIVTFDSVKAVNNRVPILVNDRVVGVVSTYQEVNKLQEIEAKVRKEIHKKGFVAKYALDSLLSKSKKFKDTIVAAKQYASTDSTILIIGETGTGKGLLAQGIHLASHRASGPFVAVNCSALPESLLESELFGYEEGAFTGARRRGKQGLFELAHKGTIFLDEIAGTSLHMQARLLRVVEEKEVMRVGGDQMLPLDVRIIAASNQDLRKSSADGLFRPDLFYRLNVLSLKLPPLRERKEDIIHLYRYFLRLMKGSVHTIETILDPDFSQTLSDYSWPGNVRELEHFAEKTAALSRIPSVPLASVKNNLIAELLDEERIENGDNEKNGFFVQIGSMEEMEAEIIAKLYRKYRGNKVRLAQQLKISRTTLWKKLDNILNDTMLNEKNNN